LLSSLLLGSFAYGLIGVSVLCPHESSIVEIATNARRTVDNRIRFSVSFLGSSKYF